jgi:uncharacterized protein YgiM (DUF1202 family)
MQKAIFFLIIFLALLGLDACSAAVPVATGLTAIPSEIATRTSTLATEPAVEVLAVIQAVPTKAKPACAVISADEALHLRQAPNPNARVLAFMQSGEVVKLMSTANADWWLIQRGELTGYARSRYLEKAQCGGD